MPKLSPYSLKAKDFDPAVRSELVVIAERGVAELALDQDGLPARADGNEQIVAAVAGAREGEVLRRDIVAEDEQVGRAQENGGLMLGDDVVAVAGMDDIEIGVVAALEPVVALAADQNVGMHGADHMVVAVGAGADRGHDLRYLVDGAVGELDVLDALVAAQQHVGAHRDDIGELAGDPHRLAGRLDGDEEIEAVAADRDVVGGEEGEADAVARRLRLDVVDRGMADGAAEDVDVLARAAGERVGAAALGDEECHSGRAGPRQSIVAGRAEAKIFDSERSRELREGERLGDAVHGRGQLRGDIIGAHQIGVEAAHAVGHGAEQGRPALPLRPKRPPDRTADPRASVR